METLEIKTAEFKAEHVMRCEGMCKGACSCPTGHCRCKVSEAYSTTSGKYEVLTSDSYEFKKAA
jgi:hypothetical protein